MKNKCGVIAVLFAFLFLKTSVASYAQTVEQLDEMRQRYYIAFYPDGRTSAGVEVTAAGVQYVIQSKYTKITLNSMNSVQIVAIEDFDFNGDLDFAISGETEGLSVYRVFVYSREKKDFVEQSPSCGTMFMDLRVDKEKKQLLSTYHEDNVQKICVTKLKKMK